MLTLHPSKMRQRKNASNTIYHNSQQHSTIIPIVQLIVVGGVKNDVGKPKFGTQAKNSHNAHHPLGVHARRLEEREYTPADTHVMARLGPTQPPTLNGHSTRSNGKAEKLQLSRAYGSQCLQVPMHLSYLSDQTSNNRPV